MIQPANNLWDYFHSGFDGDANILRLKKSKRSDNADLLFCPIETCRIVWRLYRKNYTHNTSVAELEKWSHISGYKIERLKCPDCTGIDYSKGITDYRRNYVSI